MFSNTFFIIGCARSGTTAVTKILNSSNNSKIYVEQEPNLCIESRNLYKGVLDSPVEIIKNAKEQQIKTENEKGLIFGDKNPNYLPFIPYMEKLWQPKYVFVVRDGRDVVRSLMDWNKVCKGNIYGMKEDDESSNINSPEQDWWDYSRLRPNPGDAYFKGWRGLTRFEKCCWYWNEFNAQSLKYCLSIDNNRWRIINLNKVSSGDFEKLFEFLRLNGFNSKEINTMLSSRINTSKDRGKVISEFPSWTSWSDKQMEIFHKHTKQLMRIFGYFQ
jgi:hypothetical protein